MIDSFTNENAFLSNFHRCLIFYEGIVYPTVEHAYQAAKTLDFDERLRIASIPTPGKAKRAGGKLVVQEGWDNMKLYVMEQLLHRKFMHRELQDKLIATYPLPIIEGNEGGDKFWGAVLENGEWVGKNHLGKLLTSIRQELMIVMNTPPLNKTFVEE